ncbi:mrna 3-end-processing protein rna14 [Moniliophthora roreri]|uniref:mRNA 3'-end-processing protein RNA14 n=1 Tax=Moniliophthora roreri TaxID=221103 RepID=A0A0W0G5H3_MONRR|nr:mrna 3-end-processing protein rna14 [Moniliophthora roreri]
MGFKQIIREAAGDYVPARELYQNLLTNFRTNLWHPIDNADTRIRKDFRVIYIMYMRFAHRTEGLTASQFIFNQAKEDTPLTPWLVYEAAAIMEYHDRGGKNISLEIFQTGMTYFGKDIDYVMCYLEWLISLDDQHETQVLFEAVIDGFSGQDADQLWNCWSRYMYRRGNWESIQKVELYMVHMRDASNSEHDITYSPVAHSVMLTSKNRRAIAKEILLAERLSSFPHKPLEEAFDRA